MTRYNKIICTIPFHFTNSYMQVVNEMSSSGIWKSEEIVTGENDLYDYITNLIGSNNCKSQIASSWKLNESELPRNNRNELVDYVVSEKKKHFVWNILGVGLVIFKNGIAILWYEIKTKNDKLPVEDIELFLYKVKEFSFKNIYVQFNENWSPELQNKINTEEDLLLLQEIRDKKSETPVRIMYGKRVDFFSNYIEGYLIPFDGKDYFATKKIGENKDIEVPDRSIIFSVVYEVKTDVDEEDYYKNAYWLGRVYKNSYKMSPVEIDNNFYRGFEDSIWYASREGCANYLCTQEENPFYAGTYKGRIDTYFYVYLLCLGQYYSLLQFAQEVATLSTDEKEYIKTDEVLEEMQDRIRIFNLKNNYSQVGHLTPHNEFYEYLQNRLGINRMQEELEVELQALYEMIERKNSIRQAKNYKVITIIGGIFVVLQAFINVAAMYGSAMAREWGYFVFATIGCIVLAILGVVLWLIDRIKPRKK